VDDAHGLRITLDALRRRGVALTEIHLEPLRVSSLTELVADTLSTSGAEVRELAELIEEKTSGNPFFVRELLKALHADGLLRFDGSARRWRWDLDAIRARSLSDNVAELVIERISRLPARCKRLLA